MHMLHSILMAFLICIGLLITVISLMLISVFIWTKKLHSIALKKIPK